MIPRPQWGQRISSTPSISRLCSEQGRGSRIRHSRNNCTAVCTCKREQMLNNNNDNSNMMWVWAWGLRISEMEHRWSTSVALFNAPYTDCVPRGNICQHRVPITGCGGVWPGLFQDAVGHCRSGKYSAANSPYLHGSSKPRNGWNGLNCSFQSVIQKVSWIKQEMLSTLGGDLVKS